MSDHNQTLIGNLELSIQDWKLALDKKLTHLNMGDASAFAEASELARNIKRAKKLVRALKGEPDA